MMKPKLSAPDNGVTIRMYRIGHGDCFLLAFPREGGGDPVYVLIDCGFKPGSPGFLDPERDIQEVVNHLHDSTGGNLDLVVITHEHQDHVNGFWKKNSPYFEPFEIQEAWFAWTESPNDALAKKLRKKHKDQLFGLIEARNQLALAVGAESPSLRRLESLLSMEAGGHEEAYDPAAIFAATEDPEKSVNKQGMKLVKEKALANRGVRYWEPGKKAIDVPGTGGIKAYVLGPPRREDLLGDEDPVGEEGFEMDSAAHAISFAAGARAVTGEGDPGQPFRREFHVSPSIAEAVPFFQQHYGFKGLASLGANGTSQKESPGDADWRRIDDEWLYSADTLALKLNRGINNTSLVLAFELRQSRKVLLFAADAQRGNWISWHECEWDDGDADRVRDLLARTVLYKVGHHGSHNATLNGERDSDYANLSWMGLRFEGEFAAMITAVNEWAMTKNDPPWRHPLPSIRTALIEKARGLVFQTDMNTVDKPAGIPAAEWARFQARFDIDDLYFDYRVIDE